MTESNKELLGLEDQEASVKEIQKESFIKKFQEINEILADLNNEQEKLKSDNKKGEDTKTKKQSEKSGKHNNYDFLRGLLGFFLGLSKMIQFDNFFGLGLLIIAAYILLSFFFSLCRAPPKRNFNKII
jgi:hypothetical protein